jgi:hypothetical protein
MNLIIPRHTKRHVPQPLTFRDLTQGSRKLWYNDATVLPAQHRMNKIFI